MTPTTLYTATRSCGNGCWRGIVRSAEGGRTWNPVWPMNIALRTAAVSECQAGDASGDGAITIDEILAAVNAILEGCAA